MGKARLKKKLIVTIPQENNKDLLELFNFMIKENSATTRISKKQYNLELDAAMERIDSNQFLTQLEVEKLLGI